MGTPQSRYVLPSFVERTTYGIKEMNPYNKLFEERIIFLGVQIDDASANDVMAQLLTLEAIDPDRDITMYINSPGGSMTSMMAIYDTMQLIARRTSPTCCIGQAASAAGGAVLAAGTKGKRMALPNSLVPSTSRRPRAATASPPTWRSKLARSCACGCDGGHPVPAHRQGRGEVRRDIERDKFLTAEDAKDYGIIDEVLIMIKRGTEPA